MKINRFMIFFFSAFAVVFLGLPIFVFSYFTAQGDFLSGSESVPVILFLSVFALAGLGFCIAVIVLIARSARESKIIKHGRRTVGKFIKSYSNTKINEKPYYNIVFAYRNDKYEEITVNTGAKFNASEARRLEEIANFEIAYINNHAVITQDLNADITASENLLREIPDSFRRYSESDNVFEFIRRELDKEPDTAARKRLLAEHSSTLKTDTLQRLEDYIAFLDKDKKSAGIK